MKKYILKLGDAVAARKLNSKREHGNLIVGPVVDINDTSLKITTNKNTEIEGNFILNLDEWDFQFLHKA